MNRLTIIFTLVVIWKIPFSKESDGCGDPGVPVSGGILGKTKEYPVGHQIVYYCLASHQIFGDKYRTCTSKGVWTGNVPICGTRMRIENATQSSDYNEKFGPNLAIDFNYTTCSITKFNVDIFWSAYIDPYVSVSGIRITKKKRPGPSKAKLSVKIASQHTQQRSSSNICLQTEDTGDLLFFLCPQNTQGDTIFIQQLSSVNIALEICEVELFTTENLSCRVPDNLRNGHRMVMNNSSTTYYIFSCDPGFELVGNGEVFCSSNGTWNPVIPVCVAIKCLNKPPRISNGLYVELRKSNEKEYLFNDSVEYHCDSGYHLTGYDAIKRCVGLNLWSGDALSCQQTKTSTALPRSSQRRRGRFTTISYSPFKCKNLIQSVIHGHFIYNNNTVTLVCDTNYEPVGYVVSQCLPGQIEGQYVWNPLPNFRCQPIGPVDTEDSEEEIFCPPLSLPNGLRLVTEGDYGGKIREGTKIQVRCRNSWADDEVDNLREPVLGVAVCGPNGTWSNVSLWCLEMDLKNQKIENKPVNDSTSILIVAAFLIGVSTAVLSIGVGTCIYVIRKSRQNGSRPSHSLFHIDLASPGTSTRTGINPYRINNDDEHIYQIPAYEDITESLCSSSTTDPETPKRRAPSSGLPLLPIYSQPFERDYRITGINPSLINPNVHIYAEPVNEPWEDSLRSYSNITENSVNYCESRTSRLDSTDSVFIENTYSDYETQETLKMVDNDLYVSEDDSENDQVQN